VKEAHAQLQILDYLALKQIFHYRNNSGAFKDKKGHFYRFGALGSPDIICVIAGQFVGIDAGQCPSNLGREHPNNSAGKAVEN